MENLMNVLEFFFNDFGHWLGLVFIIFIVCYYASNISLINIDRSNNYYYLPKNKNDETDESDNDDNADND